MLRIAERKIVLYHGFGVGDHYDFREDPAKEHDRGTRPRNTTNSTTRPTPISGPG